jgi:hypothetical protein
MLVRKTLCTTAGREVSPSAAVTPFALEVYYLSAKKRTQTGAPTFIFRPL